MLYNYDNKTLLPLVQLVELFFAGRKFMGWRRAAGIE